jgi:hypothetical protein
MAKVHDYGRVCRLPGMAAGYASGFAIRVCYNEGPCALPAKPLAPRIQPDCRNPFMRIPNSLTAFAFASFMPLAALAQQQAVQKVQAPPPPETQKLEEGEAPAVTIPGGGQRQNEIIEKRQQGRVTEVEVHTGRSSYTLKPNTPPGSALPGDAESNSNRAPQFTVKRFPVPHPQGQEPADAAAQTPQAATPPAGSGNAGSGAR